MSTPVKSRASPRNQFANDPAALKEIVADVLKYAREHGATACEAEVSEGLGQTVTVRHGEVETIEYNRDKSMGISVYIGQRRAPTRARRIFRRKPCVRPPTRRCRSRSSPRATNSRAWPTKNSSRATFRISDLVPVPWDLARRAGNRSRPARARRSVCRQQTHYEFRRRDGVAAAIAFCVRQFAGLPRGLPEFASLDQLRRDCAGKGDAMQRDDWYTAARAIRPPSMRPNSSANRPARARWRGGAQRKSRPRRCRCCSRRRWRLLCSAISCRRRAAAACIASRRSWSTAWTSNSLLAGGLDHRRPADRQRRGEQPV